MILEFLAFLPIFLLASFISFYIPGLLLLNFVGFKNDPQKFILSWSVGISIFLFAIYCTSWIGLPYIYVFILIGLGVWMVGWKRKTLLSSLKIDGISLGIILLGAFCFTLLMFFSGWQTTKGMQFISVVNTADGLLHIGYIKDLLTHFPPFHAGLANVPLRGYHYFYDLLLSRFVMFYKLSPFDLYYRYFPILISLLYGAGFYVLSTLLTKNKLSQRLILFFAFFAQSMAVVLSLFTNTINTSAELGSIYPLELILNPSIILSIGLLLCAAYILFQTKSIVKQMVFAGFVFGMITEVKVYTGIIAICIFLIVAFVRWCKKRKDFLPHVLGIVTLIGVVAVTYLPNNLGAGSLWYSPFFVYSVYMQDNPFKSWNWELQRRIFAMHNNIPHLTVLYIEGFGLFWILSLGSRIIFLLGLPALFHKKFWTDEKSLSLSGAMVVPILLGSLFVQSISIFDTKQFFWIAGAIIAIPSGLALGHFLSKYGKVVQVVGIVIIVLFSFPGVFRVVKNFTNSSQLFMLSQNDEKLLTDASHNLPGNSFIIYAKTQDTAISRYPFSDGPVVAAFTGHATYFESESAQFDLQSVYEERKTNLKALEVSLSTCDKNTILPLIQKIGSQYIITTGREKCLAKLSSFVENSQSGLTYYILK